MRWVARALLAVPVVVLAVAFGIGWLYGLHSAGVLVIGPPVGGALPLQRLAGGDAQPLARLLVAWLPAGFIAGAALRRLRLAGGPVLLALGGWALLVVTSAESVGITESRGLGPYLAGQATRPATLLAVVLLWLGARAARSLSPSDGFATRAASWRSASSSSSPCSRPSPPHDRTAPPSVPAARST